MSRDHEFISVQEAVIFTGKSEKTIRNVIKELLEEEGTTSGKTSRSLRIETKGENNRRFYHISKLWLIKRFQLPTNQLPEVSGIVPDTSRSTTTSIDDTSGSDEDDVLREWLQDKTKTIELLEGQLAIKDTQIRDKDQQLLAMGKLIENQQTLTLQAQKLFLDGKTDSSEDLKTKKNENISPKRVVVVQTILGILLVLALISITFLGFYYFQRFYFK